ncbi:MAG TPA: anthranilate phosphoribosyltransferase [bacterium]|nr:anthranilate phosphoribosyltransferase [bacterium]
MDIQEAIRKTVEGEDLSIQESRAVAATVMEGAATDAQIAALLVALRLKGETIDEVTGFARAMRERASAVKCGFDRLVDTCGTGGDRSGTFNVSTVCALVAAGAGSRVAKHGNRSVSSRCGSADVFKELGVRIELSPDQMGRCIDETGIGFLFAPLLHPAMKYAVGPRREMGIRTIFNILGPLTNPAGVKRQILGIFDPRLTEPIATVLHQLGSEHVMVVHGDGLDEITLTGETRVSELKDGNVKTFSIQPEDFGFRRISIDDIRGGDPAVNAQITLAILGGKEKGARRDLVVLNAGAAIYVSGSAGTLEEGIGMAAESLDSGRALSVLESLKAMTQGMGE